MELVTYIITALSAYVMGSVPTGYWVGRSRGLDIRKLGSGNIGATNVFRILGKPAGVLVLLVDAFKGWLSCQWIGALVWSWLPGGTPDAGTVEWLKVTGGLAAILGHNYTCFLNFKGGKGIATSAGVTLALMPGAMGLALAVWVVCFAATRYVSVASMVAALALPVAAWWPAGSSVRIIFIAAAIGILAVYKHRGNIERLRNGTENRFGKKKEVSL